ncbi:LysR family transcriptional regulator [Sphingomonas sp. MMS24-J13]|uniref:LysR family transcriptional regulator n=1 Tax=Sphingomonas sp. MMS24-J13 TaxID=3238686 RepID=UPI00385024B5
MLHARLLRYIDEVARSGSIRKAAQHLNISSTAINRQIIAYEETIGTKIFERLPRSVRPTAAGELLLRHIRTTLKEHARVREQIAGLRGLHGGSVTIAAFENLVINLMPQVVAEFRSNHPRVRVHIRAVNGPQLIAGLSAGDYDLGLGYNLGVPPGISALATFPTRLGAIVATEHPLAQRAAVRLSDCAAYPLIVGDDSMTIHAIIREAFDEGNLPFHPQILSNSVGLMKSLARRQEGITFMTRVDIAEEWLRGELVHVPIHDEVIRDQPLSLVYRKSGMLPPAVSKLAEITRGALKGLLG